MQNKTLKYFKELSKIPRKSKNEEKAIAWCIDWAKDRNYSYKTDTIGNLLIEVPATTGMEYKETVVLQGHIDMVCVKSAESNHDFSKDEITIIEKDGWLHADNTTLGADNGIGVCMAMAACDLEKHPSLEILITVDEEQGMSGAIELEKDFISGTRLINLDSEDEGEITIGSAGGARINIVGKYKTKISDKQAYSFEFTGIKGGHSGVEIHKSLGNAVDSFFLFLEYLDIDFELSSLYSGIAENAIPKELKAILTIKQINDLDKKIEQFKKDYSKEFKEYNFDIKYTLLDEKIEVISLIDSYKLRETILKSKSGVYKMSEELKDFVLTSQNLGILKLENGIIEIDYLSRSSIESDLNYLIDLNKKLYRQIGKVKVKDPNPGWAENIDSDLIKLVKSSYEKVTKGNVELLGVHAGLECGAIINKMPENSKAVSIGPNIYGAHTIEERCEIKSIGVLCDILKDILENA